MPTTPTPSRRRCRSGARSAYAAWVTIQIGCDNSCAFCIVPVGAGQGDQPPVRRARRRGRAAGRRRRRRGHAARPERQLLRPRPHAGRRRAGGHAGSRAAVRRPARAAVGASRASAGSATPARTPRTSGPRRSPPWPTTPAVCEHLHLPLQSGSDRVLAAMHRGYTAERYLEPARARPGRPCPTWPSPPTSSSASPARPTTTSSARSRSWPRPSTTAPTRSSTRPGPAPRRPSGSTSSCPPTSWPSGSSGCGWWSSARRWPSTEARIGRVEEVARRGPEHARTRRCSPAAPARTSSCTSPVGRPAAAGHVRRRRASPAPAPHHLRGELRRGHRRRPPPHPHPGRRRLSRRGRATPVRPVGASTAPFRSGAARQSRPSGRRRCPPTRRRRRRRGVGAGLGQGRHRGLAGRRAGRSTGILKIGPAGGADGTVGRAGAAGVARRPAATPPSRCARGAGRAPAGCSPATVPGVPAHDPASPACARSALIEALGRGLRRFHDELPVDACPFDARLDVLLASAERRVAAGGVDPATLGPTYRRHTPDELLEHLLAMRPAEPTTTSWSPTATRACPTCWSTRAAIEVTGIVDLGRLGVSDRYRDLAIVARSLVQNLGPEVGPVFFDAYGSPHPDPRGSSSTCCSTSCGDATRATASAAAPRRSPSSAPPRRASRRWPWRSPARHRDVELVSVDSMQVYRGMDIGTAKPTPAEQAEVPHHLIDLVDPCEEFDVALFQQRGRERRSPTSTARGHRAAAGRRHRPVPAGGRSTTSTSRAGTPRSRAELDAEPDTAGSAPPAAELDPVGRGRMEPTQPAAGRPGARGDARQRPAVLVVRSRARRPTRRRRFDLVGVCAARGRSWPTRDRRRATHASSTPASSTRCARWPAGPRLSAAPPRRRSATGSCSPTSTASATARRCGRRGGRAAPAGSPAASGCGSGATPASSWLDADDDPLGIRRSSVARARSLGDRATDAATLAAMLRSPSTTASATTSSCCSTLDGHRRRGRPTLARAAVRPPPRHRRRRAAARSAATPATASTS